MGLPWNTASLGVPGEGVNSFPSQKVFTWSLYLPLLQTPATFELGRHSLLPRSLCCSLSSAQSGAHALGARMFFHRSTAVSHIYSHVSEHTCVCQALSFPCPWTRFSGTCWEARSHEEHKSYCLSTCTSTPQPERGPALHSKKSNNSVYQKTSLILPRIGPRHRSI